MSEPDPAAGVYTISVAAELAGVTVRSLRLYERHGLLAAGPHHRRHPPVQPGRPAPVPPDRRTGRRRGQPHRHRQDPRPGTGHPRAPRRQHRPARRQHPAAGRQRATLPAGNAPAQDKEPARRRSSSRHAPTDGHRDQSVQTGLTRPADHQRTAHHERTTIMPTPSWTSERTRVMPDPAQAAVTALTGSTTETVGRFSYDVPTDTWWWSTSLYTIHGFTPGEIVPTTALMLAHQHPDDRAGAVQLITAAVTAGKPFSSRHRILDAQRRVHTVVTIGEGIRDDARPDRPGPRLPHRRHRCPAPRPRGRDPDGGRAVRRNPGRDRTGQGRPDDHLRTRRGRGVRVAALALPAQQHQTPGHRRRPSPTAPTTPASPTSPPTGRSPKSSPTSPTRPPRHPPRPVRPRPSDPRNDSAPDRPGQQPGQAW